MGKDGDRVSGGGGVQGSCIILKQLPNVTRTTNQVFQGSDYIDEEPFLLPLIF